ncbi:MAG: OmpH family outer membrane protein [Gemmatimonadales bacterium]|nr:MAG: OmpH family outer membrane protein [Gemmatimonadales bacterium]
MRVLSFALTGILLLGSVSMAEAQTPRIGYIDSQAILAEAPGSREAQQAFDQEMNRYRGEMQRLGEELDRLVTAYQQQERNLTPEAREARQQEIRRKEGEYQARMEEIDDEASRKRQELVEPILERMSQVIETVRAEGSYALIFDTASRSIIAADPALDLTDEVLRRLQQMASNGN